MKGAGSCFSRRATAPSASAFRFSAPSGTISMRTTGTPALATWAAMPLPITPDPITATFFMSIAKFLLAGRGVARPPFRGYRR